MTRHMIGFTFVAFLSDARQPGPGVPLFCTFKKYVPEEEAPQGDQILAAGGVDFAYHAPPAQSKDHVGYFFKPISTAGLVPVLGGRTVVPMLTNADNRRYPEITRALWRRDFGAVVSYLDGTPYTSR